MVDKNAKKVGEKRSKLYEKTENSLINVIYVKISEENLILLSEEYSEFDNVALTLNWDLGQLKKTLRPWKVLWRFDEDFYKPSVLVEFFEVTKHEDYVPIEVYDQASNRILESLTKISAELESYGLLKIDPTFLGKKYKDPVFNCDIINKLEDKYGEEGAELIQEYATLDNRYIEIIRGFYREITRSNKSDYLTRKLKGESLDVIADFIPSWYKDEFKIFGHSSKIDENLSNIPQFKKEGLVGAVNTEQIQQEMIDEIFAEFELGSILRGSEIRTRFREIYAKYGLNPKATLSEFQRYFVIRKAKSEYEWYYRIVQRRDI